MKGIHIVTGDDRSSPWQDTSEMCVAVIDDMEHAKLGRTPAQPARVVPQPCCEAVCEKRSRRTFDDWQSSAPGRHRGLQPGGCNTPARDGWQPVDEHVSDQIHARPAFFREIADDPDRKRLKNHHGGNRENRENS